MAGLAPKDLGAGGTFPSLPLRSGAVAVSAQRGQRSLPQPSAVTRGKLSVSIQASEWIKITIRQEASLALSFVMWLLYEAASSLSLLGSPAQCR